MSIRCWKTVVGHLLVFRWTELVPIIWSEVSTPPMYLLYSVTMVGLGTEIFWCGPSPDLCQRCTVCPEYTGWMVEHRETSLVSIHFVNRRPPSLIHRILPRGDLLLRPFSVVVGTPTLPCLYKNKKKNMITILSCHSTSYTETKFCGQPFYITCMFHKHQIPAGSDVGRGGDWCRNYLYR